MTKNTKKNRGKKRWQKRWQKRSKKKKNKKKRSKKLNKKQCSAKNKHDFLDFTCYKPTMLYKMRTIWNTRNPHLSIKTNNLKKIWESLGNYMQKSCKNEVCWMKSNLFKNRFTSKELKNIFAPAQPTEWKKNPNEWLSSIEISELMKQYEDAYKCFEFIGPTPIDFDEHLAYGKCVWEDLCKFNLKDKIDKGINKIGIIFNLDTHDKPGSHWTSMFINFKLKKIYYFDSYGDDLSPKRVITLANRIQEQSKEFGKEYKFIINKKRHQYSRSECGMYCLYFIIQLIKDVPFSRFSKKVNDKYMKRLRNKYFNQH